jgi:predicted amidophosphoribosyltransferase
MALDYLRKWRKQNNFCVQCGAELDRDGIYCTRCNNLNNTSKAKIVKELHSNKFCTTCAEPLDREGWFCKKCAGKLKQRAKTRSAERRAKGLCVQCGEKTEGTSQCRRCLDKLIERRNKKNKT